MNTEHQCPQCGTTYFESQECDWCPGQHTTPVPDAPQPSTEQREPELA